jgi:endonuclease YncB( thermonuclease family)
MRSLRYAKRGRHLAIWLALIAILAAFARISGPLVPEGKPFSGRAEAVDGDTLRIGRDRVRLLGIDAPEIGQSCRRDGRDWPCGIAARAEMVRLLAAGRTQCTPRGHDVYGRILAHCRTNGTDLSARMADVGLAVSRQDYGAEQTHAQRVQAGIWAGPFEDPRAWRDAHSSAGVQHSPLEWIKNWLNR